MKSISRKSDTCLNCGFPLKETDNFCPNCGQENRNKKVPLKLIFKDFLGDYYTFDSKFFRSLFPLIFKPGFLTNEYNSGKRTKYIPPLRMYIFISILFFFVVGITGDPSEDAGKTEEAGKNQVSVGDTSELGDKKGIMMSMETGDLNVNIGDTKDVFTKELMEGAIKDEKKMDGIFDSLNIGKTKFRKFLARVFITQFIKLKDQKESFSSYFMRNASFMMFFLMPLFAALLKLYYIRRKKFYMEHLIFSFHLHSFAFLLLTITEIFDDSLVDIVGVLLILTYLFIALRKVYQQSWGKTVFKYFITLTSYFFCLTFCILATLVVTFLFF